MRKNLPVTGNEYILRDDQSPISRTDLQGNITFANADFIEASGFTEDEMLGQPHHMVRHPDMPTEAFADMWTHLQAGHAWSGMVKNRRKNGDHYWVLSNASPMWERGQMVGFASVRMKPPGQSIAPTEAIYRRFRAGKAHGLRIERGQVVRTGLLGRFDQLRHPGIRGRLVYLLLLASVLMVALGWLGLTGLHETNQAHLGAQLVQQNMSTKAIMNASDAVYATARTEVLVAILVGLALIWTVGWPRVPQSLRSHWRRRGVTCCAPPTSSA